MDNITNSPWGPRIPFKPPKKNNTPPLSKKTSKVNDAVTGSLFTPHVHDKGKSRTVAKTEKDPTKGIASKKLEPPKTLPKPQLTSARRKELGLPEKTPPKKAPKPKPHPYPKSGTGNIR